MYRTPTCIQLPGNSTVLLCNCSSNAHLKPKQTCFPDFPPSPLAPDPSHLCLGQLGTCYSSLEHVIYRSESSVFSSTPVKPRMAGQIHAKSSVTSWGGSCTHSRCLTRHTAPYSLHKEGRTTLVLLIQLCVLNGFSEAAIHSAAQERETRQSSCCCSVTSQRSHGREGHDCRGDKAGRAGAPSATSYGHRCGLCRCTEEESMRGVNTRGRTRGTKHQPST